MVEQLKTLPKKGEQYFYIDKYYDVDSKHYWGEDDKLDAENVRKGNIYFSIDFAREEAKKAKYIASISKTLKEENK